MARKLKTDLEIDSFIAKVIDEASHHALMVEHIIQPLSDVVRARLNLSVDTVEVYERNGNLARTCWIIIADKRYVFTYNYGSNKIDLRERSLRGANKAEFDNTSTLTEIQEIVSAL